MAYMGTMVRWKGAFLWGAGLFFCCCMVLACKKASKEPTLQVYAASSLTEAFRDAKRAFEKEHPGARVVLTFAGSQVLRLQIEHGAEADVFASANPVHMRALQRAGRVGKSRVLATNELVLIVPQSNPANISSFRELPRARRLVLGSPNVPVGRYARRMLERAAKTLGRSFRTTVGSRVVSEESNVRLVRAKVVLGEADAAIVYRTDAMATQRVKRIPIPASFHVRAIYPIGVVAGSKQKQLSRRWIRFLRSGKGRALLARRGFVVP